jgi:hypothetical protein
MESTRRLTFVSLLLSLLAASAGSAATIGSVTSVINPNPNNADLLVAALPELRDRNGSSPPALLGSTASTFDTRYAGSVGVDALFSASPSVILLLDVDYTLTIDILAAPAETWDLVVDQRRAGTISVVNDGTGGAAAGVLAATGAATGATLSAGSLGMPSVGVFSAAGDYAFDQTASGTLAGTGPATVTLTFQFRLGALTVPTGVFGSGDEGAVRMGLDSRLPPALFAAGVYPDPSQAANDGHFVSASLISAAAPEASPLLLALMGLAGLGLHGRGRSAQTGKRDGCTT